MKKIISACALIGAIALTGNARPIDQGEAMDIARSFMSTTNTQMRAKGNSDNTLSIAYTAQNSTNNNLLYVFNRGTDNGFIIVAGDDAVDHTILGYSDSGTFDYDNMPENMRSWLAGYEQEISAAHSLSRTQIKYAPAKERESLFNKNVGPLVEARWSQEAPYNNLCPEYSATTRSATGCVATAMAQIMYHHKFPEHGVGTKDVQNGTRIETIDFAGTTYEWDLMLPVYSSLSTEAECNAVATLMYHVGRSVNMMYSNVSGAVSAESAQAWATYWNYDKAVVHRDRNFYTIDQWEQLIIDEIDNSRPILYHGQSPDGGHAFVLDGYNDEGYVHINWGWNGMSNGYFMLHALTPEKQGVGGFSGGYNTGQGAVFGIQPNKGNKTAIEITASGIYIDNEREYDLGEQISTVVTALANAGWSTASFSAGFMIYDSNDNLVETVNSGNYTINGSSSLSTQNIALTLPATLADGNYHVYLAHTDANGNWKRVAMDVNTQPYYIFCITNGKASIITEEEGEIYASSVVCDETIYSKRFATFTITMGNTMNHEYFGSIYVSIYESKGKFEQRKSSAIALSIPANEEITIEIPIKIEVGKGNYCIFITDGNKNKLSEGLPIEVLAEPTAADLQVSNYKLLCSAIDQMEVEYTITNNGGDYTGKIRSWVLFSNRQSSSSFADTEEITLKQGESIDIKQIWAFDDGIVGEKYICSLWYDDSRTGGMSQLGNEEFAFTLQEETSIEGITADGTTIYPNIATQYVTVESNNAIDKVVIINMQGATVMTTQCNTKAATLDVAHLANGVYFVVATTTEGTIVEKIIKQ